MLKTSKDVITSMINFGQTWFLNTISTSTAIALALIFVFDYTIIQNKRHDLQNSRSHLLSLEYSINLLWQQYFCNQDPATEYEDENNDWPDKPYPVWVLHIQHLQRSHNQSGWCQEEHCVLTKLVGGNNDVPWNMNRVGQWCQDWHSKNCQTRWRWHDETKNEEDQHHHNDEDRTGHVPN